MIRLLKGTVELIDHPHIIIDVHGVGYYVYATADVLSHISAAGEQIKLFIYTHIREDLLDLYGFSALEDLKLFESFLNVSGIGPKTAIGIFAAGNRERIIQAIIASDVAFFSSVPRLGKKNAQKLLIELKSKVGALENTHLSIASTSADGEVVNALKSFGFSTSEIYDAIGHISADGKTVSEKVRLTLKYLGK